MFLIGVFVILLSSTNVAIFTTSEAGLSHPVSNYVFRIKVHLEELNLVDQTKISSSKMRHNVKNAWGNKMLKTHLSFSCFLSSFLLSHFGLFWHFVKLFHRDTSATISVEGGSLNLCGFLTGQMKTNYSLTTSPRLHKKAKANIPYGKAVKAVRKMFILVNQLIYLSLKFLLMV